MTRRLSLLTLLLLSSALFAEEAKSARETLLRAIKAAGGEKLLAAKALQGKSRGTLLLLGNKSPVNNEFFVQGLDQVKWSSEVTLNDKQVTAVLVIDKDKGWIKGDNAEPGTLEKKQIKAFLQGFAALRLVESLVPLTTKEWKLSSLGELKIQDRSAIGIKAVKKGLPELDIFFDKETHLPLKAEMRIEEPDGKDIPYTAHFSDYKKFAGRLFFTRLKVYREEMLVLEMERQEIQVKDNLPAETFAKP